MDFLSEFQYDTEYLHAGIIYEGITYSLVDNHMKEFATPSAFLAMEQAAGEMCIRDRTDILLLDEPTTYLDIAYQVEILDLLTDLNKKRNTTILMVLHDINLSARYADYIFAMYQGRLEAQGAPLKIITPGLIKKIYGLDCQIIPDPVSRTPLVIPEGRHHKTIQA